MYIYPNPASGDILITGPTGLSAVSFYNSQGALVLQSQTNSETIAIDVSAYQRGIYLIQIVDLNGNVSTGKIVLE